MIGQSDQPACFPRTGWTRKRSILARIQRGERVEHFETVRVARMAR